mmetsp:Transcript_31488/g.66669  ORF Transcript_31488/g.66669 Transcript_31488/m.66669 type:complete len:205 (+) Transcript_31488:708-1322(+)
MRFIELPVASARITSFNDNSDVLISAPSILVVRHACDVSAPRSLPARSMNVKRPCSLCLIRPISLRRLSCNTAWDLLLSAFAEVVPVDLFDAPASIISINSSALPTGCSDSPGKLTFPLLSSRHLIGRLRFNKSNNFPPYISNNDTPILMFSCSGSSAIRKTSCAARKYRPRFSSEMLSDWFPALDPVMLHPIIVNVFPEPVWP